MYAATEKYGRCVICLVTFLIFVPIVGCENVDGPEDGVYTAAQVTQLAECLSASGAVLYGANWCPYTHQQIEAFGDAFTHVNYVECTEQPSVCDQAGVTSYPTWVIGGRVQPGLCDLATLAALSGCN